MKTLYRTAFTLKNCPNPRQDIHAVAKVCLDWVFAPAGKSRRGVVRPATAPVRCENFNSDIGHGHHLETCYLKQNEHRHWGLRFTHPDSSDAGIEWRVELTLVSDAVSCRFTCQTAVARTDSSFDPIRRSPTQPKVVRDIVEKYGAIDSHSGKELSNKPYEAKEDSLESLRDFLVNPERRQTVVMVSQNRESGLLVDVRLWAEKLATLAYVMVAEDHRYTFGLERVLESHRLVCWGGSIRIYRPGFTLGANPYDHPLLVPASIRESIENYGEIGLADNVLAQVAEYAVSRGYPGAMFWYELTQLINRATVERLKSESNSDAELANLYSADLTAKNKLLEEKQLELQAASVEIDRLREWQKSAMRAFAEIRSGTDGKIAIRGIPEVDSVREAIAQAKLEFRNQLIFKLNSKSDEDTPYGEPTEVLHALRWMAQVYYQAKVGNRPCGDIPASLRSILPRWEYSGDQSEATVGMFAEWYRIDHAYRNGRKAFATTHIGAGRSRRPEETIRIGFDWDPDQKVIVVGYVGQHQRNRLS